MDNYLNNTAPIHSMKKGTIFIMLFLLIIFNSGCEKEREIPELSPQFNEDCGDMVQGKINIKLKEGYDLSTNIKSAEAVNDIIAKGDFEIPEKIQKIFSSAKVGTKNKQLQEKIGLDRWIKLTISDNLDLEQELEKWDLMPEIEQVSLDYVPCLLLTPSDSTIYDKQWYHNNTGDNVDGAVLGADIDTPEAWEIQTGNITIAVPDTSIFWNHEDLIENIWQNLGEDFDGDGKVIQPNGTEYIYDVYEDYPDPGTNTTINRSYTKYIFDPDDVNGIDDDGNGYIDDFIGWDFDDNDNDPIYDSTDSVTWQWHGTQTAGVFAAKGNNSIGGAGVCWDCKIIAMRGVLNPESIQYAIENGAKVISMSWIHTEPHGPLWDVLDYAYESDIVLLTGIGNYAPEGSHNAMCHKENIICLAGSRQDDSAWENSEYILEKGRYADLGSPSKAIWTPTPYNHPISIYTYTDGTSLGTPIAAGVVALMLTENPNLNPDEVKSILLSSTDSYSSIENGSYAGIGRLNANKALNLTLSAKIHGSFPVSIIDEFNSVQNNDSYDIIGTATSPNFEKYDVFYSHGHYNDTWAHLGEFFNPVENSTLYSALLEDFPFGEGQFKIIVKDRNNQTSYDIIHQIFEVPPIPLNQTIALTEGWNSGSILVEGASSTNFESRIVVMYEGGQWIVDHYLIDSDYFELYSWGGYMVYSKDNKSIILEGYAPSDPLPAFGGNWWNFITHNETGIYGDISGYGYSEYIQIFDIILNENSFSYQQLNTSSTILMREKPYWIAFIPP